MDASMTTTARGKIERAIASQFGGYIHISIARMLHQVVPDRRMARAASSVLTWPGSRTLGVPMAPTLLR